MKLPNATATPSISDAVSGHPSAAHTVTRRSDGISSPPFQLRSRGVPLIRHGTSASRETKGAIRRPRATGRSCNQQGMGLCQINQDPCTVAGRLWAKERLDPEEEKLRFAK